MAHGREEVQAAFEEYVRRGVGTHDWPGWAELFTDDAVYIEHNLGRFRGRAEIRDWIIPTMAEFPAMTLWIDWVMIDGDRVVFYIWNNLPDPEGRGRSFQFPNATVLEYAGDGLWSYEEDLYNPADAERVVKAWIAAGGRRNTPPDRSLQGIAGHAPAVPTPEAPREEVVAALARYHERADRAVATGDWVAWAAQFTDDARYYEHHFGRFEGRAAIEAWITGVMKPFTTMDFLVEWDVVDGNRVAFLCQNRLPDPAGQGRLFQFPTLTVLHYAGNDHWSYEEDIYNPQEAPPAVEAWVAAGGKMA